MGQWKTIWTDVTAPALMSSQICPKISIALWAALV
jgi:hypothetical protein